ACPAPEHRPCPALDFRRDFALQLAPNAANHLTAEGTPMSSPFVTTDWLAQHLSDANLVLVDASWYMPNAGRNPEEEYRAGHLPGAGSFDIDDIADHTTDLPHMLPSPAEFADAVGKLGISEDMTIVVYDEQGLFSASRVWWTFRTFGAKDV